MRRTITDTADRLRPYDTVTYDGRRMYIADITNASTRANPGRLAILLADPAGQTVAATGILLILGTGATLEVEPSPDIYRLGPGGITRVRQVGGGGFQVWNSILGEWVYIGYGSDRHPWDYVGLPDATTTQLRALTYETTQRSSVAA